MNSCPLHVEKFEASLRNNLLQLTFQPFGEQYSSWWVQTYRQTINVLMGERLDRNRRRLRSNGSDALGLR
jgi:hypothetical protein